MISVLLNGAIDAAQECEVMQGYQWSRSKEQEGRKKKKVYIFHRIRWRRQRIRVQLNIEEKYFNGNCCCHPSPGEAKCTHSFFLFHVQTLWYTCLFSLESERRGDHITWNHTYAYTCAFILWTRREERQQLSPCTISCHLLFLPTRDSSNVLLS